MASRDSMSARYYGALHYLTRDQFSVAGLKSAGMKSARINVAGMKRARVKRTGVEIIVVNRPGVKRTFRNRHHFDVALLFLAGICLSGCSGAYYGAWEKLGVHKRDILVERVEAASEAQAAAKEEFRSAYQQFASVVRIPPSELQKTYESLLEVFEDASERADTVTDRIDAVESVSEALFDEWQDEIRQITSDSLRSQSASQLKASRRQYTDLIRAMRRAEAKMTPVLDAFRDQVLFLKHNLNARAIASLQGELAGIEKDVAALIRDMEASIEKSQKFIDDMSVSESG